MLEKKIILRVKLKELLASKNVTLVSLSELTKIHYRWLTDFSNNHITLFQGEKIAKICKELNCSTNDLFEICEIEKKNNLVVA